MRRRSTSSLWRSGSGADWRFASSASSWASSASASAMNRSTVLIRASSCSSVSRVPPQGGLRVVSQTPQPPAAWHRESRCLAQPRPSDNGLARKLRTAALRASVSAGVSTRSGFRGSIICIPTRISAAIAL